LFGVFRCVSATVSCDVYESFGLSYLPGRLSGG
jgi:hypothetical protein